MGHLPESTPKQRKEKMDELQRNVNPDPDGGALISGMTKRIGYDNGGNQSPIQGMDKDYRRKSSL